MPEPPVHCKTDDKDESAGIYLDVIWDKNVHPFPPPPLPESGGLRRNMHPFELPAIPKEEDPADENIIYDQPDYWPIGQWPKFRRSWKERFNPLHLRNKTILVIVLIAASSFGVAIIFISRSFIMQTAQNDGKFLFWTLAKCWI